MIIIIIIIIIITYRDIENQLKIRNQDTIIITCMPPV